MVRIDSKATYDWFYLADIPRHISFYAGGSEFELSDETLDISLDDLKNVLRLIKSGMYTFKQVFDWSELFFYLRGKLTYAQRHPVLNYQFEVWETGFEGDELDYILEVLYIELEDMYGEEKTDIVLLYPYIDDLMDDIEMFEKEKYQGTNIRANFSKMRTIRIMISFAMMGSNTICLDEDEIMLYKEMRKRLIDFQEGDYYNKNIEVKRYVNNIVIRAKTKEEIIDKRICYIFDFIGGISV